MAKKIDLDELTRDELIKLNKQIIGKIKELDAESTTSFNIGDKVKFRTKKGRVVEGTVNKVNKKTIDIMDDSVTMKWRVSASMLQRA